MHNRSDMLKVVYDHQVFSLQKYGGISRCFVELHKHMPDSCKATIAVRETENVYARELEEVKPIGYDYDHFICNHHFLGKGHLHLWYDKLRRVKYYPDYNKNFLLYLLQKSDFDVFHPTYFDDYFLSYLNEKPFVLTIHDMIPELYPQYFGKDDFQIVKKKKLAPLASAIIAVSENTKKDIIRILNIPEEKIHVIYHGSSFPMEGGNAKYSFPYILFVGERGLYKNFSLFVRHVLPVLKRYREINIVCTGRPFDLKEKEMLNEYGVGDRFYHHWVTNDYELFSLYHHAKCFVYPSEYEGFGIPILEAYQADCPVLLNNASCFPEIAGDAAIYFNMDSKNSNLTEQIECLLSMSAEERRTLLTRQRERLKRFSWEKSAKQLADVYQSVINENNHVH